MNNFDFLNDDFFKVDNFKDDEDKKPIDQNKKVYQPAGRRNLAYNKKEDQTDNTDNLNNNTQKDDSSNNLNIDTGVSPMFNSQMFNVNNRVHRAEREEPDPIPETIEEEEEPKPTPNTLGLDITPAGGQNWAVASWRPTPAQKKDGGGMMQSISFAGAKNAYQKLELELKANGVKYRDSDFPAEVSSIMGFGGNPSYPQHRMEKIIWQRPDAIYGNGSFSVYDQIEPDDIKQGGLGDCYFLSAMAAIAEYKDRIKRVFLQRKVSDYGVYCVGFYINGIFEEVIIDDKFPCNPYSKKPEFNSSVENELWVMIMEKAWAKVFGGYVNINAGIIREALTGLTGAPCITYFNDEKTQEERFNILWDADVNRHIMCAGTEDLMGDGTDQQEKKTGIVGSHAYALTKVFTLVWEGDHWEILKHGQSNNGKRTERLLQLRNPWGKGESKMAWSDDSYKWKDVPAHVKKEMGHVIEDDGCFFIGFSDFEKYYSDFQVCYYHDTYRLNSFKWETRKDEAKDCTFEIKEQAEIYFSLHQVNKRFFKKSQKYEYSQCNLIVIRKDSKGQWVLVGSAGKQQSEFWFKADCPPGIYYAQIYTPWQSLSKTIAFSAYAPFNIDVKDQRDGKIQAAWIGEALGASANLQKDGWKTFAGQGEPDCAYKFETEPGLGYVAFRNNGKSTMNCTLNLSTCRGCEVMPPYDGTMKPLVVNEPGEIDVVWLRRGDNSNFGFSMSTQFQKASADLHDQVKTKGKQYNRKKNGQDVKIIVYILRHTTGAIFQYENHSHDYTLDETIKFDLKNAYIIGSTSQEARLEVKPRRMKTLEIKSTNNRDWDMKILRNTFNVF